MTQLKDNQRSQKIQALVNDGDFLKNLVQNFLQQYLETEITEFLPLCLCVFVSQGTAPAPLARVRLRALPCAPCILEIEPFNMTRAVTDGCSWHWRPGDRSLRVY